MVLESRNFSLTIPEEKMRKAKKIIKTATEDSISTWPEVPHSLQAGQLIILCRHHENKLYFTFGAVQSCKEGLYLIKAEGIYGRESFTQWSALQNVKYCTV